VVVADSSFAAIELLAAVRNKVCMITRLRLDAALYGPAPPRARATQGRPRRQGARLPTPHAVVENPATVWQRVTIERWYSQGPKQVDIAISPVAPRCGCTVACRSYHCVGYPPLHDRSKKLAV
jgi:hypothetical protein